MIENISRTIEITTATLKIPPKDYSKATTTVFKLDDVDKNLSGLKIRRSLSTLMKGRFTVVRQASIIEVNTMKKSS